MTFIINLAKAATTLPKVQEAIWKCVARDTEKWTGKSCSTGILQHQINKGGGKEIVQTRWLKSTEAAGIAGGGDAARAKPFEEGDAIKENTLYFTVTTAPKSDFCGTFTGIQWSGGVKLQKAFYVDPRGENVFANGITEEEMSLFGSDCRKG